MHGMLVLQLLWELCQAWWIVQRLQVINSPHHGEDIPTTLRTEGSVPRSRSWEKSFM